MRITEYNAKITREDDLTVLVKEKATNYETTAKGLNTPEAIVEMMNVIFKLNQCAEEYFYMIAFNAMYKPIGVFEISHGTVDYTVLSPREVLIRALLSAAVSITLIHNHPSGFTTPSEADIKTTKKMKEAADIIGIHLLDHIIIGDGNYHSFKESGLL